LARVRGAEPRDAKSKPPDPPQSQQLDHPLAADIIHGALPVGTTAPYPAIDRTKPMEIGCEHNPRCVARWDNSTLPTMVHCPLLGHQHPIENPANKNPANKNPKSSKDNLGFGIY
jgi:hypothetical protein